MIADIIICGGNSQSMSSSSAELHETLSSTAPQANSSGDVEGGNSDFSVVHDRIPIALTLFEATKTQLNLIDLSKAEGRRAIVQGAYQMVGDIQRLANVIRHVTTYSSLLTNGLVWIHLRRVERPYGAVWLHSSPITVVKKAGRGKHKVDDAGIDTVVKNILYALVTAKNIFEAITDIFTSNQKVDVNHGQLKINLFCIFNVKYLIIAGLRRR